MRPVTRQHLTGAPVPLCPVLATGESPYPTTTLGTLMATINGSTPASCNASDVACWQYGRVQLRCVIVDDDQVFLVAARALLERDGVVVAGVAHSRVEAIQQAEALRPDVVLIDIRLGQESGFEVARQLADNGQMAALIMISTHAGADYADLIAESPAKGFVAKTDLSAAAIRRVLGAD